MIRFDCDYLEGAYPKIIEKLVETNMEQIQNSTIILVLIVVFDIHYRNFWKNVFLLLDQYLIMIELFEQLFFHDDVF